MKYLNRYFLLKIILIIYIIMIASCSKSEQVEFITPPEQVEVVVIEKEIVKPEFITFGTVVFFNKADIFPTAEGHIDAIYVEEGMVIDKGDILAKLRQQKLLISREDAEASVESKQALLTLSEEKLVQGVKGIEAKLIAIRNAEAELEQKRNEFLNISTTYENKQRLFDAGGVTKEELDAVRTQYLSYETKLIQTEGELEIQYLGFRDEDIISAGYQVPHSEEEKYNILVLLNTKMLVAERDVAEAELNSALSSLKTIELLIDETIIRSPISGTIGSRYLDIGEKATPETKLFTIFNTDKVYIQIEVSERDLLRILPGQTAYVILDSWTIEAKEESSNPVSDSSISGTVKLISPFINPETRTCGIKIEVLNSNKLLTPGQFVNIKIITGEPEERIAIPEKSILTDDSGNEYVFLIRDSRLFKQSIVSDYTSNNRIIVKEGLEIGDIICKKPSHTFLDGLEVEAIR